MFNFFSTEENTKDEKQTFDKDILMFSSLTFSFALKKLNIKYVFSMLFFPANNLD